MPASFNGSSLGFIFRMEVAANAKARQINTYPGADGLQVIDHGARGGNTAVLGALFGASASALAAAEQRFRTLQIDGRPYVLVDTLGTAWDGVILLEYQPRERIYLTINNYLARRYTAEFLHIF